MGLNWLQLLRYRQGLSDISIPTGRKDPLPSCNSFHPPAATERSTCPEGALRSRPEVQDMPWIPLGERGHDGLPGPEGWGVNGWSPPRRQTGRPWVLPKSLAGRETERRLRDRWRLHLPRASDSLLRSLMSLGTACPRPSPAGQR